MRKLLLLLLLMIPASVLGQTTTVTGTITDPNGNPYANGTASAQKVVATGINPGVPVNVTTNGAGLFTMTLPSPASYIFTICATPTQLGPKANPTPVQVCFANSNPIAISGASQDVSATLNAIAVTLGPNISANVAGANITYTGANGHNGTETFKLINGTRHVDNINYACTGAGIQQALTDATSTGNNIVDARDCPSSATPYTATINIPAGVTLQLPASSPLICGVASAPCMNLAGNGSKVLCDFRFTVQAAISGQSLCGIRAGAGVTATTDLLTINNNNNSAIEGVEVGGLMLDFANVNATTGRNCLAIYGASRVDLHHLSILSCGYDGIREESGVAHAYHFDGYRITVSAVGGAAAANGTTSNGFIWSTGGGIWQIVGNGVTATMTCYQLCPPNGSNVTVFQNTVAGFNVNATLTSSSGNTATFASATNATGFGGEYSYCNTSPSCSTGQLADIDHIHCIDCVYYGATQGSSELGSYGYHLQAVPSSPTCASSGANCNSVADVNFINSFSQGQKSTTSTVGIAAANGIVGNSSTQIATITCTATCPPIWSVPTITGNSAYSGAVELLTSSGTTATFPSPSGSTGNNGTLTYSNGAGLFLESVNNASLADAFIVDVMWHGGEIEDTANPGTLNPGTGWKVSSASATACNNLPCFSGIEVFAAGFGNYTTAHNMISGPSGNTYTYNNMLTLPQGFEPGEIRFKGQLPPTATSSNPNCRIVWDSATTAQGAPAGVYCMYLDQGGFLNFDRTDTGPTHILQLDAQNKTYIAPDNTFKFFDHTRASAQEVAAYNFWVNNQAIQSTTAGLSSVGTTSNPFGSLWLGTAATNNFKFQPASTTGARIITVADPLSPTTVGLPFTIATGTSTLTANATLGAATCQAAITTGATGVLTTDSIYWSFATAPATGDAISSVASYVTAGNVNFTRCNPTAASQNVTAIVINWRVVR